MYVISFKFSTVSNVSHVTLIKKAAKTVQVSWYKVYKPLRPHTCESTGDFLKKNNFALTRQIGRCRPHSFLCPHSQPVPKCLNCLWQVKENLLSRLPANKSPVLDCFHTSFSVITLTFQSVFKYFRFQNAYYVRFKYLSDFPLGNLQCSA